MPLDPALAALLAKMAADPTFVRPTATDLAGARGSHEADARRFTPPEIRSSVANVEDLEIPGPAGSLAVRIYRPNSSVKLPTIVWYHGGGWTTGSLETGDILARALCNATPAVVVSVAYRLAPEHTSPAATDDTIAAMRWTAARVGKLGGDEGRLAVGGDSAGGNLAAIAAQTARDDGLRLAAQILLYPFLDLDIELTTRYPSLDENATGYYVTLDDLRWCVRNYLAADTMATSPGISPALNPNLAGLPATVLAVAEYDPLRDQGTAYAKSLNATGVPVILHQGTGLIHGYCDMLGMAPIAALELKSVLGSVRETMALP